MFLWGIFTMASNILPFVLPAERHPLVSHSFSTCMSPSCILLQFAVSGFTFHVIFSASDLLSQFLHVLTKNVKIYLLEPFCESGQVQILCTIKRTDVLCVRYIPEIKLGTIWQWVGQCIGHCSMLIRIFTWKVSMDSNWVSQASWEQCFLLSLLLEIPI